MKTKPTASLFYIILTAMILIFVVPGCSSDQTITEEPVIEEIEETEQEEAELITEELITPLVHYWPWINYGHLDLSSGEVILGPNLFESDLGSVAEFTEGYSFDGLLVWLVQESDVFSLEWVKLAFNVEYYEHNELLADLYYEFTIEDLQPVPEEQGLQEFSINLADQQQNFEVVIKRVLLGKEQESNLSTNLINYVALDIEMRVVDNY